MTPQPDSTLPQRVDRSSRKGGTPHPAARTTCAQPGDSWGLPDKAARYPIVQPGNGGGGGTPAISNVHSSYKACRRGKGGGGLTKRGKPPPSDQQCAPIKIFLLEGSGGGTPDIQIPPTGRRNRSKGGNKGTAASNGTRRSRTATNRGEGASIRASMIHHGPYSSSTAGDKPN